MKAYAKAPALGKRCKQKKKLKDLKYNGIHNTPAEIINLEGNKFMRWENMTFNF